MKNSRLFVIFVSLTACAFFFTSCTIEKRHYRNGYYIQRSNTTPLTQEPLEERAAASNSLENGTLTPSDCISQEIQITSKQKNASEAPPAAIARHPNTELKLSEGFGPKPDSADTDFNKIKPTLLQSKLDKAAVEHDKKKPWLTIAVVSLLLAVVLLVLFGESMLVFVSAGLIVISFIFSILSIVYYKRKNRTDRINWRSAVAIGVAIISGLGLFFYGLWIWLVIAWGG